MIERFIDPFPEDSPDALERLHWILAIWEQLEVGGSPGETVGRELDRLKAEVRTALRQVPMDITTAETVTAYALLILTGQTEF